MNISDEVTNREEGIVARFETLEAAAASEKVHNLFDILAEADQEHHDALVQVTGNLSPQKAQFKLLQGGACLYKNAPGRA
jgi:rubrerythrin